MGINNLNQRIDDRQSFSARHREKKQKLRTPRLTAFLAPLSPFLSSPCSNFDLTDFCSYGVGLICKFVCLQFLAQSPDWAVFGNMIRQREEVRVGTAENRQNVNLCNTIFILPVLRPRREMVLGAKQPPAALRRAFASCSA